MFRCIHPSWTLRGRACLRLEGLSARHTVHCHNVGWQDGHTFLRHSLPWDVFLGGEVGPKSVPSWSQVGNWQFETRVPIFGRQQDFASQCTSLMSRCRTWLRPWVPSSGRRRQRRCFAATLPPHRAVHRSVDSGGGGRHLLAETTWREGSGSHRRRSASRCGNTRYVHMQPSFNLLCRPHTCLQLCRTRLTSRLLCKPPGQNSSLHEQKHGM